MGLGSGAGWGLGGVGRFGVGGLGRFGRVVRGVAVVAREGRTAAATAVQRRGPLLHVAPRRYYAVLEQMQPYSWVRITGSHISTSRGHTARTVRRWVSPGIPSLWDRRRCGSSAPAGARGNPWARCLMWSAINSHAPPVGSRVNFWDS